AVVASPARRGGRQTAMVSGAAQSQAPWPGPSLCLMRLACMRLPLRQAVDSFGGRKIRISAQKCTRAETEKRSGLMMITAGCTGGWGDVTIMRGSRGAKRAAHGEPGA